MFKWPIIKFACMDSCISMWISSDSWLESIIITHFFRKKLPNSDTELAGHCQRMDSAMEIILWREWRVPRERRNGLTWRFLSCPWCYMASQLIQDLEEDRIDFMRLSLWDYANGLSAVSVMEDEVASPSEPQLWINSDHSSWHNRLLHLRNLIAAMRDDSKDIREMWYWARHQAIHLPIQYWCRNIS